MRVKILMNSPNNVGLLRYLWYDQAPQLLIVAPIIEQAVNHHVSVVDILLIVGSD
eukprot:COSAG01_NODE_3235_length_6375_cov_12.478808_5_plen_55_part_00